MLSFSLFSNTVISVRAANEEYNIVSHNYVTNETEYLYYDDSIWSSSQAIKGTIVYGNTARNIEVDIPLLGTKKSSEVVIDGATFQLRCGPNYVSIKASHTIYCNEKTAFFAFGVA